MDFWERQRQMFDERETELLQEMTAFIAGAGGLGTHQAVELTRCGIKKIYLADFDRIEPSNLNRQICYGQGDIGESKCRKAADFLNSFGLGTEIIPLEILVGEETEIPADVDIVFDALDSFPARFKLAAAAARKGAPLIHGGVHSWYGQVTTIIPGRTPGLKDIFGEMRDSGEKIPALSPAVAVVASLQVVEGIKVYLKRDNTLAGRLLLADLNDYSLEIIELESPEVKS